MGVKLVEKYQKLINDCFWEYDFRPNDIIKMIRSDDFQKKKFLFGKILANSTQLLKDLKIFSKEDLQSLVNAYVVPEFNYKFLYRRKNIVEFYFFNKELMIEELKWAG